MSFIVSDLKRGFTERNFVLSILTGLACLVLSCFFVAQSGYDSGFDFFKSSHGMFLPFIAPILAAFPYSNMNMIEKHSRYNVFMNLRQNKMALIFKRYLTNCAISGFSVFLPCFCLFLVCLFMGLDEYISEILGVLFLNFLFGASFGSLSYCLTFFTDKKYIPIVAPQVIYLLFIYSFPVLGLERFYPPLGFSPWILSSVFELSNIVLFLCFLTFISLVLILISIGYKFFSGKVFFGGDFD